MISRTTKLISAFIATLLVMTFVFGLAESISSGFAGFYGGLPFWVIAITVMCFALYDMYDETFKKK